MRILIAPPSIDELAYPEQERDHIRLAKTSLDGMLMYVNNVDACVALFDASAARSAALRAERIGEFSTESERSEGAMLSAWRHIAARDGAVQIYHVGEAMKAINSGARTYPTLWSKVDAAAVAAARADFDKVFPHSEAIRHAVGHSATRASTKERFNDVAAHGYTSDWLNASPETRVMVHDVLDGRKFTTTVKNAIVHYEISSGTVDELVRILTMFYVAFAGAQAYGRP